MSRPEQQHPLKRAQRENPNNRATTDSKKEFDLSRRRVLIAGVAGGTGLALGGAAYLYRMLSQIPSHESTQDYLKIFGAEAKTIDDTLAQADVVMQQLRENLTPKLETLNQTDRTQLLSPIDLYDLNKGNADRNQAKYIRARLEKEGNQIIRTGQLEFSFPDSRFFSFRLFNKNTFNHTTAAYAPFNRTLYLPENASMNILDVLVLYHELTHTEQDTRMRAGFKTQTELDQYLEFYKSGNGLGNRLVGSKEQEAHLKGITAFDLLTNGDFKKELLVGNFDPDYYIRKFGLRADQRSTIYPLIVYANQAFRTGATLGNITPSYANVINESSRRLGFSIYEYIDGKFQLAH